MSAYSELQKELYNKINEMFGGNFEITQTFTHGQATTYLQQLKEGSLSANPVVIVTLKKILTPIINSKSKESASIDDYFSRLEKLAKEEMKRTSVIARSQVKFILQPAEEAKRLADYAFKTTSDMAATKLNEKLQTEDILAVASMSGGILYEDCARSAQHQFTIIVPKEKFSEPSDSMFENDSSKDIRATTNIIIHDKLNNVHIDIGSFIVRHYQDSQKSYNIRMDELFNYLQKITEIPKNTFAYLFSLYFSTNNFSFMLPQYVDYNKQTYSARCENPEVALYIDKDNQYSIKFKLDFNKLSSGNFDGDIISSLENKTHPYPGFLRLEFDYFPKKGPIGSGYAITNISLEILEGVELNSKNLPDISSSIIDDLVEFFYRLLSWFSFEPTKENCTYLLSVLKDNLSPEDDKDGSKKAKIMNQVEDRIRYSTGMFIGQNPISQPIQSSSPNSTKLPIDQNKSRLLIVEEIKTFSEKKKSPPELLKPESLKANATNLRLSVPILAPIPFSNDQSSSSNNMQQVNKNNSVSNRSSMNSNLTKNAAFQADLNATLKSKKNISEKDPKETKDHKSNTISSSVLSAATTSPEQNPSNSSTPNKLSPEFLDALQKSLSMHQPAKKPEQKNTPSNS